MSLFLAKYSVAMRSMWVFRLALLSFVFANPSITALAAHSLNPIPSLNSCPTHASDSEPNGMITVNTPSVQGEYLIITYTIQYPGMTKVKMFDGSHHLLWRSQYVNDKEGEHRVILRRQSLASGNYIFEFNYKNQKRTVEISL